MTLILLLLGNLLINTGIAVAEESVGASILSPPSLQEREGRALSTSDRSSTYDGWYSFGLLPGLRINPDLRAMKVLVKRSGRVLSAVKVADKEVIWEDTTDTPSGRDGTKCTERLRAVFDIDKYLESRKLEEQDLKDERARLEKKMDEEIDVIKRESNFDLILIQEKHLSGEPLFLRPSGHKLRPHHGTIAVVQKQQGGDLYVRYRISGGDSIAVKVPMCADDSHAFFNVGTFDGDEQIDFQIIEQRGNGEIVKAARKMSVRPGAYSLRGGVVVIPSSKSANLSIEPAIQINIREAFGEGKRVGDAPCRLWPLSSLLREVSTEDFHCGLSFGITPSSSPVVYTFGPSLEAGDILDLTVGVAVYSVSDSIKVRGFVGTTLDLRILKVFLKGAEELVGLSS